MALHTQCAFHVGLKPVERIVDDSEYQARSLAIDAHQRLHAPSIGPREELVLADTETNSTRMLVIPRTARMLE